MRVGTGFKFAQFENAGGLGLLVVTRFQRLVVDRILIDYRATRMVAFVCKRTFIDPPYICYILELCTA
ncbi:hypothetical protein OKW45_003725 [Paraburkholderia sp. WSM4175]